MLRGRFDGFAVDTEQVGKDTDISGVLEYNDTFRITVKDDDDNVLYKNEAEPFSYKQVSSLPSLIAFLGGSVSDDGISTIGSALPGDKNGEAVKELLERFNSDEKQRSQRNAYARVLNEKKPVSEESIGNSLARIVRNVMKTKSLSDETAVEMLKTMEFLPADYTVEQFRSNKSKV